MKILLFFLITFILPLSIAAQTIDPQSEKLMDDLVQKSLFTEKTVIGPEGVSKVFTGKFFHVKAGFNEVNGSSMCGDFNLNINNGKIIIFEQLDTDKELPLLFSLLKKDFLLKDEPAAGLFEAALNELYQLDEKEKTVVKHMKKNNQWIFIRDKFFDNYTAIIATTGTSGAVSKLEVILSYEVK